MDNVFCDGNENDVMHCRFDGWGNNDCTSTEAAGVICEDKSPDDVKEAKKAEKVKVTL